MTKRHCLRGFLAGLLIPGLLAAQAATPAATDIAPRMLPVPIHAAPMQPLANVTTEPAAAHNRPLPTVSDRSGSYMSGSNASGSKEPGGKRWQRRAVLLSAGFTLTSGAVAYWSTREADKAYDRYLRSAGATRQQQALDDAETHDRIAGASFLLMEAGIVLTTRYLFF